jgi:dihydrofolate reductase
MHQWFFGTRTFQKMAVDYAPSLIGSEVDKGGVDDDFAVRSFENVGSWILGRNMFGPVRGPWPDDQWKGWWGDEPPYHCQVFVLTHHARVPLEMKGGTVFHFVTGGIHEALERARKAAAGRDVRIGGGVATLRQYLQAKLIDELHLAQRPVLSGRGENLFAGLDMRELGYGVAEQVVGERATHLRLLRAS